MAQQRTIKGTAVAPGLALGPVHIVRATPHVVPTWTVPEEEIEREIARLHEAVDLATDELRRRQRLVAAQSGEKDAQIFSVHRHLLNEQSTLRKLEGSIKDQRVNTEACVQQLIESFQRRFANLEGDSVRAYASDVSDPWRLVLELLMSHEREAIVSGTGQVVLAAAELTPQVATYLERDRIQAIVTETGGRFSHGAVLARSFGIPCIVGLPNLISRLEQGMRVCVDGDRGLLQLRPEQADVDQFLQRLARRQARQKALALHAALPSETPDGGRLLVMANIESVRDLDTFDVMHTDGVGLLRTEFLYMERNQFPSEDEQYRLYRQVLRRMEGRPMALRTLDIGNDKQLPYFKIPKESNPALGWRGLRISLQWPDLLRVQLRAALRASAHGQLRVLLPMVSSVEEVQEVHRIFDDVKRQLHDQGYEVAPNIPVGAMLEVPSSVWVLEHLLKEVDFVSVGTNDLVQYLLAADRDNPWVAKLYDPLHPAVICALTHIGRCARAAGKPSSVCGEMAGDYATALMLLGMGFTGVSVAPNLLNEIKYAVRRTPSSEALEIARAAQAESSVEGVRRVHERQVDHNLQEAALHESEPEDPSKKRE